MNNTFNPNQVDFQFETKRASKATMASLRFMIQDALEAYQATGSGKYTDQLSVYRQELAKREDKREDKRAAASMRRLEA